MNQLAPAPTEAPADRGPRRSQPAPLSTTASVTTFGHLAWLGWVWVVTAVVVLGIVVIVGASPEGDLDSSLWQGAAAGWQRWLVLAAGVTTTSTFAPMLVGNGVTRAQLARSVVVTGVVLAVLGTLVIVAGYLVEGVLFDRNGWTQALRGDDGVVDGGTLPGLALRYGLGLAAAFVSGWLIGLGFYRFAREKAILLIVPGIIPLVLTELLLLHGGTGVTIGAPDDIDGPPLALGAPGALAVTAIAVLVAARANRELALKE